MGTRKQTNLEQLQELRRKQTFISEQLCAISTQCTRLRLEYDEAIERWHKLSDDLHMIIAQIKEVEGGY